MLRIKSTIYLTGQANNPPQAEPKFKITNFGISLKFACPPSFWWGACSLELACFLPARRLFGGVLVVWSLFVFCLPAVFLVGYL